jgi:hypothetical protein
LLGFICDFFEKPVVLLFDDIDTLVGNTLLSVLRQLRSSFDERPRRFPASIILCGVRDIKDYRIYTLNNEMVTTGSAFNIRAQSIRMKGFSLKEVGLLLLEHTNYCGQIFEKGVAEFIYDKSWGQPWLVNAIAFELTSRMKENRDPKVLITLDMAEKAVNVIVLSRATHLDQLANCLKEEKVLATIKPIITNTYDFSKGADLQYCVNLGLIKKTELGIEISNPIYEKCFETLLADKPEIWDIAV